MITKSSIKTGMRVKTKEGKFYYVVEDWIHKNPEGDIAMNAMLIAVDRNDDIMFYGLLNYDEQLRLHGMEDSPWNIESVYIFTGEDLQEMNNSEMEANWVEITEAVQLNQDLLEKYFEKFN